MAAAVKLGLAGGNELDDDETADLVELAADGRSSRREARWAAISFDTGSASPSSDGESLVYWLRKLVFRERMARPPRQGRPARGRLGRRRGRVRLPRPSGGRALLELAPVPSWHELQFRR